MLEAVYILTFVARSTWPSENAISVEFACLPVTLVCVFIRIEHATFTFRQKGFSIDLSFVIFLILVVNSGICFGIIVECDCEFFLVILRIVDVEFTFFRFPFLNEAIELEKALVVGNFPIAVD